MTTLTEQALAIKCPLRRCGAKPGEQCKMLGSKSYGFGYMLETYKPHNERYAKVKAMAKGTTVSAERRRAARAAALRKHKTNMDVGRALAQHDSIEREQLRRWLQQHGSILWL